MRRSVLALVIALVTAGCSDDRGTGEGDARAALTSSTGPAPTIGAEDDDGPTDANPVRSVGCGTAPPAAGVTTQTITTADGIERTYRRYVPSSHDGTTPHALLLGFHGLTGGPEQMAALGGFEPVAETEGFVVVSPQGTTPDTLGVSFWNTEVNPPSERDPTLNVDDVAFVIALLDELEADLCLDTTRIFSTGMSNGGMFSARLACDLADRIAAIATVTGILHPDDCAPTRAVPVLHIHGTGDPIVPFDGGESSIAGMLDVATEPTDNVIADFSLTIPRQVADWAAAAGCATVPTVASVTDEVELREFPDCPQGTEVDFYVVEGGGHTWPGSTMFVGLDSAVGPTTFDIDATALIVEWFERHALD